MEDFFSRKKIQKKLEINCRNREKKKRKKCNKGSKTEDLSVSGGVKGYVTGGVRLGYCREGLGYCGGV